MSNYSDLLVEARIETEAYRLAASKYLPAGYIPLMYEELRRQNPNISLEEARDRIEKDCAGIWPKQTILDALPDESINQGKQKDDIRF